ncbi:hypothetical protein RZS28_10725 [Methylocapsa polymorpha]|uniref:Uncharacterized protein n=1 Tax=Methylocapsa polymorpha TaxID=3080828 RepID=A0ABZ0HMZ5_9HYPH|nr:hypothetical protein RZS28_10725 [Methylocapsa sp. RX1]
MNFPVKNRPLFSAETLNVVCICLAEHRTPDRPFLIAAQFEDGSVIPLAYEADIGKAYRYAGKIARDCGVSAQIILHPKRLEDE